MERMQRPGHSEIQLSKVTISGRVLDESGFPLAGATIQEKETANGAIADSEGKFTLVVADNAVLRVSFIGYMSDRKSTRLNSSHSRKSRMPSSA